MYTVRYILNSFLFNMIHLKKQLNIENMIRVLDGENGDFWINQNNCRINHRYQAMRNFFFKCFHFMHFNFFSEEKAHMNKYWSKMDLSHCHIIIPTGSIFKVQMMF